MTTSIPRMTTSNSWIVAIFVGGRSRRFGGVPKGHLPAPDGGTLLTRLVKVASAALPAAPIVLVGAAEAYADVALPKLEDTPPGIGPLGGLAAVLAFAERERHRGALALSCDLPYLGSALVARLARESPDAVALAPRSDGRWSPLTARFSLRALPAIDDGIRAGTHSLQRLFTLLADSAVELPLDHDEQREIRDWDRPEDMTAER